MVPTQVGERLLARAAELDAALKGGTQLATLRAAALEAGISASAFETALEELRGTDPAQAGQDAPSPRRRPRIAAFVLAVCALLLAGTMVGRVVVQPRSVEMVEEAFLLRCMPAGDAVELLRPVLGRVSSVTTFIPSDAPRVLRVHAPPGQMGVVRALIERHDGAVCAAAATTR